MPTYIGKVEAMEAFARRVWGIKPPKIKKSKSKTSKSKKPNYPKGMP